MSIMTERIKSCCALRDMSISKLERSIGASNGTISGWIKRGAQPQIDTLMATAEALGTTVAYLIGETNDPEKGKLIVENTEHPWDRFLPFTHDELMWIAAMRFCQRHSDHILDDEEMQEQVTAYLDQHGKEV